MKHFFSGLTALMSLTAFAQPNCEQFIQAAFTQTVQGNTAVFVNGSQAQFPQATTYQWYFGDGGSTSGTSVTHIYDEPGTYIVCLFAYVENCVDSVCHEVFIAGGDPCLALADATIQLNTLEGGASYSTGNVPGYAHILWHFGDGNVSDDVQGFHLYDNPGEYTVCMHGWFVIEGTNDTCSNLLCETIVIEGDSAPCDALLADFFANASPNGVQFSNATTGTGFQTTWQWSFGDGGTSDNPQPFHEYAEPGNYLICLTAISIYEQQGGGVITCTDTTCQEVTVPGEGSPCDGLNAEFSVAAQGSIAIIDNEVSSGNYTYIWDFGDGTEGYGADPVHTYPESGTYHICLLMWRWDPLTQDTCFMDVCEWVVIGSGDPCDSLQSCFQWGVQSNTATFYNCTDLIGQGLLFEWHFGDGTSSTMIDPVHQYAGPGTYTVCLTSWLPNTPDSCTDTVCHEVVIGGGGSPCDSLTAAFVVTTQNDLAAFSAFGGTAIGYHWNFGDGTEGDGPAPTHTYPGPGTYNACLITWTWDPQTQDTCYADHCEWITIGEPDLCDGLQAGFQAIVGDATVWFSNTTTGTGFQSTWHWDFGDGTTSNDAQPSHIFPGLGTYEVCLTVTSLFEQQGGGVITCVDTTCQEVTVPGEGSPCDGLNPEFTATISGTSVSVQAGFNPTGTTYQWIFGDGTFGDGANTTHTYSGPGTYDVCLIVGNYDPLAEDSCFADHCQSVIITGGNGPCDQLQADFFANASPNGVQFSNATTGTGFQTTWQWSFGDGGTSDNPQPFHEYAEPGSYLVCLTAISIYEQQGGGVITCADTTCQEVTVPGEGSPCEGLNPEFTATISGTSVSIQAGFNPTGTTYQWIFGDGTFGDGANTTHTYPEAGTYNVCLIVGNYDPIEQDSCFEDHCLLITLEQGGGPCDSLWSATFEFGHQGNVFTFFNTSNTQGTEVSTHWSFGDGTFGEGSQLVHTYVSSGVYVVCMTITGIIPGTNDSCQVAVCQTIELSVGMNGLAGASTISVWPQPFDGVLQVAGPGSQGSTHCMLLDMTGRVVDDRTAHTQGVITLDYAHLPPGTYVLRLRNATTDRSLRVMKR